MSSVI